ncbi:XisI protein [Trichormus azollae]|jgi:hypothetical protein|uniref:XisI protein n=1 Tax=Nostoc azollae (strain 0708) TaxID=551115 RepID=D7DYX0_NOSA0|nr:XisI protein [Trichormus azollae]ADI64449.1 XisI protein ['Nostoc azollae' 0708]
MATIDEYRQHIKGPLTARAQLVWDKRIQAETIFDTEYDHYQLVYVGWGNSKQVYGTVLHLDISDGNIWVHQDGTEVGIANELVKLSVPKKDIVLGFNPPKLRHYTDFAVG